jgi:hypothetical protein
LIHSPNKRAGGGADVDDVNGDASTEETTWLVHSTHQKRSSSGVGSGVGVKTETVVATATRPLFDTISANEFTSSSSGSPNGRHSTGRVWPLFAHGVPVHTRPHSSASSVSCFISVPVHTRHIRILLLWPGHSVPVSAQPDWLLLEHQCTRTHTRTHSPHHLPGLATPYGSSPCLNPVIQSQLNTLKMLPVKLLHPPPSTLNPKPQALNP